MGGAVDRGLTSSNVVFGEDIDRPFVFLDGAGDGDGEADGAAKVSTGCVWLRVGTWRSLPRSFSVALDTSGSDTLSTDLPPPFANR